MNSMSRDQAINLIKKRINWVGPEDKHGNTLYDGFDMSGYHKSDYKNLELLGRFHDVIRSPRERRDTNGGFFMPMFWKGCGSIVRFDNQTIDPYSKGIDISGKTTLEIIVRIFELKGVIEPRSYSYQEVVDNAI